MKKNMASGGKTDYLRGGIIKWQSLILAVFTKDLKSS